jgi:hypothetical protein
VTQYFQYRLFSLHSHYIVPLLLPSFPKNASNIL